jgi:exosome complex RNA-binding protein Rrp4
MEERQNNNAELVSEEEVGEHPMNALMEEAFRFQTPKQGDIVEGVIVNVTPTEVLVDVGGKSEGLVPSKELERLVRCKARRSGREHDPVDPAC